MRTHGGWTVVKDDWDDIRGHGGYGESEGLDGGLREQTHRFGFVTVGSILSLVWIGLLNTLCASEAERSHSTGFVELSGPYFTPLGMHLRP